MFVQIEANVHELQLWCHLTLQVTESVLCSQVFSELLWFCDLQQCDSHQILVSKDIRQLKPWFCRQEAHLSSNQSMYLHNNSFWKMLDFLQKSVMRQHMIVCCHIFLCDLLLIFLILVSLVLLNMARFIQTSCVDGLCFVFRVHFNNALCPILWEDSEAWKSCNILGSLAISENSLPSPVLF